MTATMSPLWENILKQTFPHLHNIFILLTLSNYLRAVDIISPALIILYEYLYLLNRFSKFICLLDFRFIVNISHVHIASCKHMAKIFPAQMFHLSWNLICFSSVILFAGQTFTQIPQRIQALFTKNAFAFSPLSCCSISGTHIAERSVSVCVGFELIAVWPDRFLKFLHGSSC